MLPHQQQNQPQNQPPKTLNFARLNVDVIPRHATKWKEDASR